MSTKIDYKKALADLKKLKVSSVTAYDGRKTLTKSQKSTIKKNYDKYGQIAQSKSEFISKDISHYEANEKKALTKAGYKIIGNKLYVDKQGMTNIDIKRKLAYETRITASGKKVKKAVPVVTIERSAPGERPEMEIITNPSGHMTLKERLLKEYEQGNLEPGQFVGLKIGQNGRFRRVIMLSVDSLYKYWVDDFDPKDRGTNKSELEDYVHLVIISERDGGGGKFHERTQKEKARVQRKRKKSSAYVSKNTLVGKVSKSKSKK